MVARTWKRFAAIAGLSFVLATGEARAALEPVTSIALPGGGNVRGAALVLDAAETHLYVTSTQGVTVYSRDTGTGALTLLQNVDGTDDNGLLNARPLVLSPDERFLYVGDAAGELVTLARDTGSGLLSYVGVQFVGGIPVNLVLSPDGANLYFIPGDGRVVVLGRIVATGALTGVVDLAPDSVTDMVFVGPGLVGYTAGDGWAYGSDGIPFGRDGEVMYVTRNPSTGVISLSQIFTGEQFGMAKATIAAAASPDGVSVYVAGDDYVGQFRAQVPYSSDQQVIRGGKNGASSLNGARAIATTSAEGHVYVATEEGDSGAQFSGQVVSFTRDLVSGRLAPVEAVLAPTAPAALAASSDDKDVYAVSITSATVDSYRQAEVCTELPRSGCHPATKALLSLHGGNKPSLRYQWENSAAAFALAGDPWGGTTYSLCLYQDVAGVWSRIVTADAPQGRRGGGRGWVRDTGFMSFRYRDRFHLPDGVTSAVLDRHRVRVKASGPRLSLPAVPPTPSLRAQVMSEFGECWSADFDAADVRVSNPTTERFLARSDG